MAVHRSLELLHDGEVEYRNSPHLAQRSLRGRLLRLLRSSIVAASDAGLGLRALEIGAGHGGYTEQLLAAGCEVTVVDMSRRAVGRTQATFGHNERLTAVHDRDATLAAVNDRYSLVLCLSVLHHVPDYIDFLDRVTKRLVPGGTLLTLQDPLWYPRVGRLTYLVDRSAYLLWRIAQGNVREGVQAMCRRIGGTHPQAKHDDDIVYFHVVRQGVDEQAVSSFLLEAFDEVEVLSYWSNHLAAVGPLAERAGLANTFAVRATGFSA